MDIEEAKNNYLKLKPNKEWIESIDRNFFFEFAETVLAELEKKDKVINEMAYCIYNYQICEYEIQDSRDRKCEYIADDENPPCKECIKQYFIRKVEENG